VRKAIVETATGLVINVIEVESDDDGGYSHWACPDGCELIDSDKSGPGWTWDASSQTFSAPTVELPSRLSVLMAGATTVFTASDDPEGTDVWEDKDSATLAAERTELLALLHAKLQSDPDNLTEAEKLKMLALERES